MLILSTFNCTWSNHLFSSTCFKSVSVTISKKIFDYLCKKQNMYMGDSSIWGTFEFWNIEKKKVVWSLFFPISDGLIIDLEHRSEHSFDCTSWSCDSIVVFSMLSITTTKHWFLYKITWQARFVWNMLDKNYVLSICKCI